MGEGVLAVVFCLALVAAVVVGSSLPSTLIAATKNGKSGDDLYSPVTLQDFNSLLGPGDYDGRLTYDYLDPSRLEDWLSSKRPSSPLLGTMADLDKYCKDNNTNAAVALGIAGRESEWGTTGGASENSPYGFTPAGAGTPLTRFDSIAAAHEAWCKNLKAKYIDLNFPGLKEISFKYSDNFKCDGQEGRSCFPYGIDTDWSGIDDQARARYNSDWLYGDSPDNKNGVWAYAAEIYRYCKPSLNVDNITWAGNMCFPAAGPHNFHNDWHEPRTGHLHQGCDIFADMGTPAVACCNGTITLVAEGGNAGKYLRLTMEGSSTFFYYMHMEDIVVSEGQQVRAGDLVGRVGDTGNAKGGSPHIHFQYHPNGGEPAPPYPLLVKLDAGQAPGDEGGWK